MKLKQSLQDLKNTQDISLLDQIEEDHPPDWNMDRMFEKSYRNYLERSLKESFTGISNNQKRKGIYRAIGLAACMIVTLGMSLGIWSRQQRIETCPATETTTTAVTETTVQTTTEMQINDSESVRIVETTISNAEIPESETSSATSAAKAESSQNVMSTTAGRNSETESLAVTTSGTNPVSAASTAVTIGRNPVPAASTAVTIGRNPVPVASTAVTIGRNPVPVASTAVTIGRNPVTVPTTVVTAGRNSVTVPSTIVSNAPETSVVMTTGMNISTELTATVTEIILTDPNEIHPTESTSTTAEPSEVITLDDSLLPWFVIEQADDYTQIRSVQEVAPSPEEWVMYSIDSDAVTLTEARKHPSVCEYSILAADTMQYLTLYQYERTVCIKDWNPAMIPEIVLIGENHGVLWKDEENGSCGLLWDDGKYMFVIETATANRELLILIAEGLK